VTTPSPATCPAIDGSKSLAELTGVDWGPPPPDARLLVQERHETRRTPLAVWTSRELIRFLAMGGDEAVLVPFAIGALRENPVASGGRRPGELLSATLECDGFDWRANPSRVHLVRDLVGTALNLIGQDEDGVRTLQAEWHIYRSWAIFERRLSAVT